MLTKLACVALKLQAPRFPKFRHITLHCHVCSLAFRCPTQEESLEVSLICLFPLPCIVAAEILHVDA